MTRVVLSIGSNLGDRMARLQSVVDGLGDSVRALSPVYETDAWGGVEQGPFLNAVVVAEDPALDGHGWLRLRAGARAGQRAGPRDQMGAAHPRRRPGLLLRASEAGEREILCRDQDLTLPHPLAHLRAFVLVPWLAVDPDAELTVAEGRCPVQRLLAELDPADRDGVRLTDLVLALNCDEAPEA